MEVCILNTNNNNNLGATGGPMSSPDSFCHLPPHPHPYPPPTHPPPCNSGPKLMHTCEKIV